jgi:hypothetical protein
MDRRLVADIQQGEMMRLEIFFSRVITSESKCFLPSHHKENPSNLELPESFYII